MITNTGKNIIAKYLIGDAPAYASYIALGCGPRPRNNSSTLSELTTASISGSITSTATTTTITGISSTAGLVPGMTLTKVSGTGALGTVATISSINGPTVITVSTSTANTVGTIVFTTSGLASRLSVLDADAAWIGAKITKVSGTGTLSTTADTIITHISSDNSITVSPGPETSLSLLEAALEIDPNKKSLDFEMFRVPISSRGYVNDNGTNKIILTAQLPTEERYEISEIGIYSAGSNAAAAQYDSKTISAFSAEEPWLFSVADTLNSPAVSSAIFPEIQTSIIDGLNFISSTADAIKTSTTNGVFSNPTRAARYERPRYLSNVYLLRGNTSNISYSNNSMQIMNTPKFLQIGGQNVDLSRNSSSDLMKLTFSIVSVDGNSSAVPDTARIIIEFSNTDGSQYARLEVDAKDSVHRFAESRYVTVTKRLDELSYSTGQFSWKNVSIIKAYVATIDDIPISNKSATGGKATFVTTVAHNLDLGDWVTISGVGNGFDGNEQVTDIVDSTTFKVANTSEVSSSVVTPNGNLEAPTNNFFIAIDALRVENINTVNPLYGLVGYSIIQNSDRKTITKSPNTNNYIEYRFILDVT